MSRIKEVTLKELRLNLTELTEELDDQTTLIVTRRKKPIAVIQHLDRERQSYYRKLLDLAKTDTASRNEAATPEPAATTPPAKPKPPAKNS